MKHRNKLRRFLFYSHRYIGLCSALFVILLSITGIMLNHTDTLKLDQRHIQTPALLKWYGIESPTISAAYPIGTQWLIGYDKQLYINNHRVTGTDNSPLGAINLQGIIISASQNELVLTTQEGELIERISRGLGLPGAISKIGLRQNSVAIKTDNGTYISDETLSEWQHVQHTDNIQWSQPQTAPDSLIRQLQYNHRGQGLTLERILLDLHSGRLAGTAGVILMDTMAILFMALAILGVWMWARR